MKSLILIVLLVASACCASAQKVFFIYLQSDAGNPFYVKMSDKIYSSAASGYLILPNLTDSTYNFSIGFPSSQVESRFSIPVKGNDRGFLIKNFDDGLGLFDLQSLSIIKAQKEEADKTISYQRRDDQFSSLLSKAAHDTSLLYAVVVNKPKVVEKNGGVATTNLKLDDLEQTPNQEDVKENKEVRDSVTTLPSADVAFDTTNPQQTLTETKQEEKNNADTLTNTITAVEAGQEKISPEVPASDSSQASNQVFKRSVINKHSESSTSEGFGLVFYDTYDGVQDTIRLLIPNPPIIFKQTAAQDTSSQQNAFIHVDDLKKDTVQVTQDVTEEKVNVPVQAKCKSIASNNDFFKLRKNMAGENTDEGMVAEAKKFFKSKCFTTEQIKNLSALFLTSAGKYQFFDAAYLHISDQENFPSLESEIKDDYYLKRFKALVGE